VALTDIISRVRWTLRVDSRSLRRGSRESRLGSRGSEADSRDSKSRSSVFVLHLRESRFEPALGDRRGKPAGVALAFVYSFVGTTPPTDLTMFKFEGSSTRTTFDILFPTTVAGGSQVWLYACWANPRTQSGPACAPVTAYLQGAAAHAA
jgi:hypothetical protein